MSTSHSSPPPPPKQPLPPKKEVALALLERSSVHVHLDPRAHGVSVPVWFKKQAQLVLQVGLNMPVPIPDLRLDDDGMMCTLSFNRSPFYCVVPWTSVFAMVDDDGRGMVWPEDVPPELANQARSAAAAEAARPALRAAPAPAEAPSEADVAKAGATRGPATASEKPRARKPRAKKARVAGAASGVAPGEPELRPTLVAVPAPEARPEKAEKNERPMKAERPEKRPAPRAEPALESPRPEAARKAPPARPLPAGPPKPKRELPPYLRVVK